MEKMQIELEVNVKDKARPKVMYECDRRACAKGCNTHSGGRCSHTEDIRHAKNFQMTPSGSFKEVVPGGGMAVEYIQAGVFSPRKIDALRKYIEKEACKHD